MKINLNKTSEKKSIKKLSIEDLSQIVGGFTKADDPTTADEGVILL